MGGVRRMRWAAAGQHAGSMAECWSGLPFSLPLVWLQTSGRWGGSTGGDHDLPIAEKTAMSKTRGYSLAFRHNS